MAGPLTPEDRRVRRFQTAILVLMVAIVVVFVLVALLTPDAV